MLNKKKTRISLGGTFSGLREVQVTQDENGKKTYKLILLREGKGNKSDRHYYSNKCINSPVTQQAFEGKPLFVNHLSEDDLRNRPEGDVKEIGGYHTQVHAEGDTLVSTFKPLKTPAGKFTTDFFDECLEYAKEYPGQNLGGISINANGESIEGEVDGEVWKIVDEIPEAISGDLVTLPGAGGMVVARESKRKNAVKAILDEMQGMVDKMGGIPQQKELSRMLKNAMSAVSGVAPEVKQEESMKTKSTRKKLTESEAEAKKKALHYVADTLDAKAKDNPNEAEAKMFGEMAKEYRSMAGTGSGEEEGDLTITHKGAPDDGDGDADGGDGDSQTESEDEKESEEEKEKKKEAEDEQEAEEEKESMRKELVAVKAELHSLKLKTKLAESGLPESWHKSVTIMCAGKNDKQTDAVIEAEVLKYEHTLREVGGRMPVKAGSFGGDKITESKRDAVLAARGF